MTNYENGVRTPLIIRAPNIQNPGGGGTRTVHLAEAVDLYKTFADAVGLLESVEPTVDGVSLLPLLREPNTLTPPRVAAQSQFPRCYSALPPIVPGGKNFTSVSVLPALDRTDCQDIPREQVMILSLDAQSQHLASSLNSILSIVFYGLHSLTSWAIRCGQPTGALPNGECGIESGFKADGICCRTQQSFMTIVQQMLQQGA